MLTPLHRYPEVKSHHSSSPWMPRRCQPKFTAKKFIAFPHLYSGWLDAIVTPTFAQDFRQSRLTVAWISAHFKAIPLVINTKILNYKPSILVWCPKERKYWPVKTSQEDTSMLYVPSRRKNVKENCCSRTTGEAAHIGLIGQPKPTKADL